MPNDTARTEAYNLLHATLTATVADTTRELDGLSRTLVSHNTVLSMGHSLYVRVTHHDNALPTVQGVGITMCSRWEARRAAEIVATADIRNGHGESPVAMPLRAALLAERANAMELLETLEAM